MPQKCSRAALTGISAAVQRRGGEDHARLRRVEKQREERLEQNQVC
jgi:hypothetical protein